MAQFTVNELADQAGARDLDRECTNVDFLDLHKFIDPWELTGQYLKLAQSQISAVDGDNKTTDQKRLGLLQKWKDIFAHKATYRVLVAALVACGKAEQALEVCKILAQKQDTVTIGDLRIFTRKVDILGAGSFGTVFKGRWHEKACAAKVLSPLGQEVLTGIPITQQAIIPEEMLQKFKRECEFMRDCQHPNIVAYYDTLLYPRCNLPVLVMELMQASLSQYIVDKGANMSLMVQISLSRDVASALEFLHDKNLIHRDLCSDNVLVNDCQHTPIAKISDFGISRMIVKPEQLSHTLTSFGHREGYLPQEAFSYPADYDASLDIFMLGVIMTLIARKVPTVKTKRDRYELVAQLGEHPLKSCIDQCLNANKDERYDAGELYADLTSLLSSVSLSNSTTEKSNVATDNDCPKKPKKKSGNKSGKNILHEGKPWKRVQPYYLPVTLIASAVIVLLIAYLVYPFVDPTTGMSDSTSTKSSPVETPISEIKPTPFGDHEMSLTEADIFSPDKTGRRIVELCIEKLNSSEFNMPNDNQFMKRVAYVMSEFGKNLKSNAGGIWQVTPAAFEDTMDTTSHIRLPRKYQKIRKAYNIDWEKVKYKDLDKPFYSALAARLYLSNFREYIPQADQIEDQAGYWKYKYMAGLGNIKDFIDKVHELEHSV